MGGGASPPCHMVLGCEREAKSENVVTQGWRSVCAKGNGPESSVWMKGRAAMA